jgi:hypothetical protein
MDGWWKGRKPGQTALSTRRAGERAFANDCGALGQSGQSRFSHSEVIAKAVGETAMPKRTTDYRSALLDDLKDPQEAAHHLNAARRRIWKRSG